MMNLPRGSICLCLVMGMLWSRCWRVWHLVRKPLCALRDSIDIAPQSDWFSFSISCKLGNDKFLDIWRHNWCRPSSFIDLFPSLHEWIFCFVPKWLSRDFGLMILGCVPWISIGELWVKMKCCWYMSYYRFWMRWSLSRMKRTILFDGDIKMTFRLKIATKKIESLV